MISYKASKKCKSLTDYKMVQKESLRRHQEEGTLSKQQWDLYELYNKYPDGLTDHDVSDFLKIPVSSVNARRNELIKSDLVTSISMTEGRYGRPNIRYGLKQLGWENL